MPEGVVVGGWPFVIAAYTITATGLVGYAWSLASRLHRARLGTPTDGENTNQKDTEP